MFGRGALKKLLAIAAGCGLLWLGLSLIATPWTPPEPPAPSRRATAALQYRAYTAWFAALDEIERPVLEASLAVAEVVASTGQLDAAARARLMAAIRQLQAVLPPAEARLARLTAPDFPAITVPRELTPSIALADARQRVRNAAASADTLVRLNDAAGARDRAAFTRTQQLSASMGLAVRTAAASRERAIFAAVPRDSSDWETYALRVDYFQTGVTLQQRLAGVSLPPDPEIAAGFLAAADRAVPLIRTGRAKLEAEIRGDEAWLQRAESRGRSDLLPAIRGNLACRRIVRERFDLWGEFEIFLRDLAAFFRTGGTRADAGGLSSRYSLIGHRLGIIGQRCNRAMGGV